MRDDDFPGFPVGETKEEFEAAVDRLMEWRNRQPDPPKRVRKSNHRLACIRRATAKLGRLVPQKYIERLERDQKLTHCCRHPEHHEIEAWFTNAVDEANGTPDLYILICPCGRRHNFFCVGAGERAVWA